MLSKNLLFLACTGFLSTAGGAEIFDAVREDDANGIQQSLKDGADIEQIGTGGQTPLIHAVLTGKINAVKTLLDAGADTTRTEKDGYNVMHAAGFQGRAEIAKILLERDIDPMNQHNDGFYPIHRACWGREKRHADTVKVFLENGVAADVASQSGKTCIEMTKNEATIQMIKDASNKASSDEF